MNKLDAGVYFNVPFSEYEKWDAVNNSLLWTLITKSPLHAKTYLDKPPERTEAFKTGRALHTLLLEPRKFHKFYAITPICDRRTKEGKAIYAAFEKVCKDKEILSQSAWQQIDEMADAIKNQTLYNLIQTGDAEVCIKWRDEKTDLLCKARLDYLHQSRAIIIDVKSTTNAAKDAFERSLYNYGYYQQAAFYCDGYKHITGDMPAFTFLPIEKEEPYAVAAYEADDKLIAAGRQSYRKALDEFARCKKKNKWPGYEKQVSMISLPQWALNKEGITEYQIFE